MVQENSERGKKKNMSTRDSSDKAENVSIFVLLRRFLLRESCEDTECQRHRGSMVGYKN